MWNVLGFEIDMIRMIFLKKIKLIQTFKLVQILNLSETKSKWTGPVSQSQYFSYFSKYVIELALDNLRTWSYLTWNSSSTAMSNTNKYKETSVQMERGPFALSYNWNNRQFIYARDVMVLGTRSIQIQLYLLIIVMPHIDRAIQT